MKKKKVVLHSTCPVKEALSYEIPDSYLFKSLTHIGEHWKNNEYVKEYEMEYLPRPKSLKNNLSARQWRLYKKLVDINNKINPSAFSLKNEIKTLPNEFSKEKNDILEAIDCALLCVGCQDLRFEISPRNVSVKGGKLVLLDVFFCSQALKKVRLKTRK